MNLSKPLRSNAFLSSKISHGYLRAHYSLQYYFSTVPWPGSRRLCRCIHSLDKYIFSFGHFLRIAILGLNARTPSITFHKATYCPFHLHPRFPAPLPFWLLVATVLLEFSIVELYFCTSRRPHVPYFSNAKLGIHLQSAAKDYKKVSVLYYNPEWDLYIYPQSSTMSRPGCTWIWQLVSKCWRIHYFGHYLCAALT